MSHKNSREVLEGLQRVGQNESVIFQISTTNWGGTPTSPTHDVFNVEDLTTSVKSTVMSGSPSVSTDDVILPAFNSGTVGETYIVIVGFTSGGNTLEAWFKITVEF